MTKSRVSLITSAIVAISGLLDGNDVYAAGPLQVSANGRYFTDDTGKAIYLTGSHTWNNCLDGPWAVGGWTCPNIFQYTTYLSWLGQHQHNFIRLWTPENTRDFEPCSPGGDCPPSGFRAIENTEMPTLYDRINQDECDIEIANGRTCNGADGQRKFNLNRFNEAYFTRLQERIEQAAAHVPTIYVSIMLFNGWGVGVYAYSPIFFPTTSPQAWWRGHPYNKLNNINGIQGGDTTLTGGGTGIYSQSEVSYNDVRDVQKAYIREVVRRVQEHNYDNVLYEIANEADGNNSPDWQNEMVSTIRKAEADGTHHPIGVTAMYNGTTAALRASGADWISPQSPDAPDLAFYDYVTNPPPADGTQVIILDTDHLGADLDRHWVWKSFTRGHNPIYMDQLDDPALAIGGAHAQNPPWTNVSIAEDARLAMGATKYYAGKANLINMTPQHGDEGTPSVYPSSTRYCLFTVGEEYLVYQPDHAQFTVSVPANRYAVEWFNPETGHCEWENDRTVIEDDDEIFIPPQGFEHDAVLYLSIYEREKIDHLPLY